MILTASYEIIDILARFLPLDLINKILNMREIMMFRDARLYWRTITPKYNYIILSCCSM